MMHAFRCQVRNMVSEGERMPRILRTLVICSLLIIGAVSPAVAAGQSGEGSVAAHGVHTNGTTDGHSP